MWSSVDDSDVFDICHDGSLHDDDTRDKIQIHRYITQNSGHHDNKGSKTDDNYRPNSVIHNSCHVYYQ